jgi:hypothetical protein
MQEAAHDAKLLSLSTQVSCLVLSLLFVDALWSNETFELLVSDTIPVILESSN